MNDSLVDFSVIKVGGGLSRLPGALERVCSALQALSQLHPMLLVPGGGPFADAVRAFERSDQPLSRLPPTGWRSWRWISTPTCSRIGSPERVLVEEPGEISGGPVGGEDRRSWRRPAGCAPPMRSRTAGR